MQDCTPLKEVIFQEIHSYICSGVPNKIKNIIEVLKFTAYVPEFPPGGRLHSSEKRHAVSGWHIG